MHDLSDLLQRSRVPWRRLSDSDIEEVAREASNAGDEVLRVRALRALARRDADTATRARVVRHLAVRR